MFDLDLLKDPDPRVTALLTIATLKLDCEEYVAGLLPLALPNHPAPHDLIDEIAQQLASARELAYDGRAAAKRLHGADADSVDVDGWIALHIDDARSIVRSELAHGKAA